MSRADLNVSLLIRDDITPTLQRLFIIFGMAGLVTRSVALPPPRPIEYAPRTWADLHLEQLGWGLLISVFTLALYVAYLMVR